MMKLAAVGWFSVSTVLCVWDALFILLRPRTLPGGDLYPLWSPYDLYTYLDKQYADMEDEFVIAQSWLNLAECVLNVAAIYLLLKGNKGGLLCGFLASAFTFWKTVLYMLLYTSLSNGSHRLAHLSWEWCAFFAAVNGTWIMCPLIVLVDFGREILSAIACPAQQSKKRQ